MKRKFTYSVVLAAFALSTGCTSVRMKKGDDAFTTLAYSKAVKYYTSALKLKEDEHARLNLAYSYMMINDPANAETNYRMVIDNKDISPGHWLNYARVLMANEKYDEAKIWLAKYLKKRPQSLVAKNLYESCNNQEALRNTDDSYEVKLVDIKGVHSAYAAVPYRSGIVFTGDVETPRSRKDPWTGNSFENLYYAEKEGAGWKAPVPLEGVVNGSYHEGAASFCNEGSTICFTRSNYQDKRNKLKKNDDDESNLKMYFANLNGEKWEGLKGMPFNSDNYSVGQPCLSADGTALYFVSDMPGGYGGTDIYVCFLKTAKDGNPSWSKPRNLGPVVNTAGNEMFPSVSSKDSMLYFSSNGHRSLGGLDIFMAKLTRQGWTAPRNMGVPINSSKDDFAYVLNDDGKSGYLSSSRDNADHIYEFRKLDPVFSLTGMITDKGKNIPLPNATIKLIDVTSNREIIVHADQQGKYTVPLSWNAEYKIDVGADNYFASFGKASTINKVRSEVIQSDFSLDEMEIEKPITIDNIFYDLNKWNIRPDATSGLDKLVQLMKENPAIRVELGSHTDARGNDKANMELSSKRAQAAVDYIVSQGISRDRLVAKGYGETMLLNKCGNGADCPEEMHQQNRRTEFRIIKTDKVVVK